MFKNCSENSYTQEDELEVTRIIMCPLAAQSLSGRNDQNRKLVKDQWNITTDIIRVKTEATTIGNNKV